MKNRCAYRALKTVSEYKSSVEFSPRAYCRDGVKIAILDNDGFDRDMLATTGFTNVTPIKHYDGPEPFSAFDIILVDIDGVGKTLDAKQQGIAVARTLKEIYPEKTILLYSGKNPQDFSVDYQNSCDGYIAKDVSMRELASQIIEKSKYLYDPVTAWERRAKSLHDHGLSYKSIAWLEDAYVESIVRGKNVMNKSLGEKLGIAVEIIKALATVVALFIP